MEGGGVLLCHITKPEALTPPPLAGTPAEVWYDNIDRWKEGEFFFSHITEIIRLATLHKYGGMYLDTDVIVIRVPPPRTNLL